MTKPLARITRARTQFRYTASLWFGGLIGCTADVEPSAAELQAAALTDAPTDEYGEGVADFHGGLVSYFDSATVRAMTRDPKFELARARAGTVAAAPSKSPTQSVLDQAAAREPSDDITIVVRLADPGFDFASLTSVPDGERAGLVDERIAAVRPIQDAAELEIAELGGVVIGRSWLANDLIVRTRSDAAARIAALPEVLEAFPGDGAVILGAGYDGDDIRNGTLAANFLAAGYEGEQDGRTSTPTDNLKVGIIEPGGLNASHVGWNDTSTGPSRIKFYYQCTGSGCTSIAPPTPVAGDTHGTRVTSSAAGSIETGQDPNFPYPGYTTLEQRQRSGPAREADIYYFDTDATNCGHVQALGRAVSAGVDIVNMSNALTCGSFTKCDKAYDCCGMNAALRAALDAGVLINACAGNCDPLDTQPCNLWYPGYRPETVGVTQLLSWDDAVPYNDLTAGTCHGPVTITLRSGTNVTTPGIEMSAPGPVRLLYGMGTNDYVAATISGCSFATPVVTGSAALLRNAFNDIGWSGNNARALMVNMMVMGDASDGTANGMLNAQVSNLSGYGRLRMHWPSATNLTNPWGWGWRDFVIRQGEEVRWNVWTSGPESSSITGWKWAFLWFEDHLASTSDIIIDVLDTCPAGGGEVVVSADDSFSLRKRIRLTQSSIGGRCLVMRARALQTPTAGTRVWSADYFHSGDNTLH